MEKITYKISLDVNRNGIQRTIQGIETGDRYLREIRITLRNGNELVELPTDDSIGISMYVTKPNSSSPSINACSRDGNEIVYTIQPSDVTTMGTVIMQMKVVASSIKGASGTLISPRFALEVWESDVVDSSEISTSTYTALDQALAQARAYYNSRITGVVVDDAYLIKVTFADGTVYTSTALQTISTKITALDTKVEGYGALIATKADKTTVNALATTVASKADTSTVNALASRVTTAELNITSLGSTKADKSTVESLASTVATKADSSTVTALSGRVTTAESNITSLGTTKADKTELATKADASTVTTLSGRVTTAESNISTNTTNIATNASSISTLSTTKADKTEVATKADKTALAETQRSLDTLWKLNKGISYDFETDSTSAYSKAIPSGAKSADLQMIGGNTHKTINLLNPTLNTITTNGVTCTRNGDGTYTVNGTATAKASFHLYPLGAWKYEYEKQYKLVGCPPNGSSTTYSLELDSSHWMYYDYGEGVLLTIPSSAESKVHAPRIVVQNGQTVTNLVFKPMLTTDTSATYDDYEMGFNGYINLWDEQWELGGISSTDGTNIAKDTIIRSKNYVGVKPSTSYKFGCVSYDNQEMGLRFYDANKTFISALAGRTNSTFNTPSNASYVRFNMIDAYGTTYKNDIYINLGTSGAYSPYGFDGIINADVTNVETVGKNIWDEQWELGDINDNGEDFAKSTMIRSKGYTEIKPSTTYFFCSNSIGNNDVFLYDSNKNLVRIVRSAYVKNKSFTTPSNAKYLRFYDTKKITYDGGISISIGTSGTYSPYTKQTIPIPTSIRNLDGYGWGIGNVYNEVDFVGKTYGNMKSVDLGTLTWSKDGDNRFFCRMGSQIVIPSSLNVCANIICDKYYTVPYNYVSQKTTEGIAITTSASQSTIFIYDTNYNDASAFKSAMSGVILHYEATEGGEDYTAKLYTKRIAKVDLGSLTWANYKDYGFRASVIGKGFNFIDNQTAFKGLCVGYTSVPVKNTLLTGQIALGGNELYMVNSDVISDASAFANTLIGHYLYYELATPLVTEITDSIDSFIVEGNGTITFKQTDSTLPIPNKEEYLIALNEVTE